jgi:hypothetical protein
VRHFIPNDNHALVLVEVLKAGLDIICVFYLSQDVSLVAITHQSRALSEAKELLLDKSGDLD